MRRILCLWLPNWPVQRLLAERDPLPPLPLGEGRGEGLIADSSFNPQPEAQGIRRAAVASKNGNLRRHDLRKSVHPHPNPLPKGEETGAPILLHTRDPRRGELIVACNDAARSRGVRPGMPLAEAAALAQRGGPCRIQPHDPAADEAALARLAEHCERFSPLVGWQTVEGSKAATSGRGSQNGESGVGSRESDCLFLDVTGIGVLFGGEEALAQEVVAEMGRLHYDARVAIAGTIGAAWAATQMQNAECRMQNAEKPCLILRTEQIPGLLPLSALRLPPETLDVLAQLGIVQLDQLLALPRESLRARFGDRLLLRVDQLLGTAQETIVAHRPLPQFSAEWVLEFPAQRHDILEQILRQLVERVAHSLAERRAGVVQLSCRLDCVPGRPLLLEVGLFRPSAEAEHLWELLRMQLEQAALPGPVGRVTLQARVTAPLENRQGELFACGEHAAQRQLALFIDRCTSRLGPDAVLRPELTADPLPERAFKMHGSKFKTRNSGHRQDRHLTSNQARAAANGNLRPLALYSPPLPIEVFSIVPIGPPAAFELDGQRHTIINPCGPERIETGWWRGRSIRRDYWRVETATGHRFWLFRNLLDGKWHLHGGF